LNGRTTQARPALGASGGFTLIEVVAALAILGTAIFVLLDSHYAALALQISTEEEIVQRHLVETTVARAEVGVLTGELSGSGDFGNRYPGYTWAYNASRVGEDDRVHLYQLTVNVQGPDAEDSAETVLETAPTEPDADPPGLVFYMYNINPEEDEGQLFR